MRRWQNKENFLGFIILTDLAIVLYSPRVIQLCTGYGAVSPHPVAGYGLGQPDYAAAAAAAGYGGYQYQCGAYPPPPAYPPHAPPYSPPCYMPPPHAPHDKPKDSR